MDRAQAGGREWCGHSISPLLLSCRYRNGTADNIKRLLVNNAGGEVGPPTRLHRGRVLRQLLAGISAPGQHTLASHGTSARPVQGPSEVSAARNCGQGSARTVRDSTLASHGTSASAVRRSFTCAGSARPTGARETAARTPKPLIPDFYLFPPGHLSMGMFTTIPGRSIVTSPLDSASLTFSIERSSLGIALSFQVTRLMDRRGL